MTFAGRADHGHDAARWRIACDACDAGAWIGPAGDGIDAWCEGCQRPRRLARGVRVASCAHCGTALTTAEPRFEELLGDGRNVAAVLAAWCGDPDPLGALLPERPRFLTDLDPPAPRPDDAPAARDALAALARGQFERARVALADLTARDRPGRGRTAAHLWRAFGIAAQRTGDTALAERAFTQAIERDPADAAARLDRGALRAMRGDAAGAREDFAQAGSRREAAWNRAALRVIAAVAIASPAPDANTIRLARDEAGEPSAYWSDHTIGRLVWSLLIEREIARRNAWGATAAGATGATTGDEAASAARVLAAAERDLEFATFWDRAMVVHGYTRLGMKREAGAAAAPLAASLLEALAAESYACGPAAGPIAPAIASARGAVGEGRPGDALAAVRGIIERPDVSRYRVPCARCGRGAIGVEDVDEGADGPE
ncbi:MAG: hypothetical protein HYR74_07315 [Candidatus Eisenbacteria bacterium]|nr:hypothetical protein [Candidatus Eisenbacteria bacterium]